MRVQRCAALVEAGEGMGRRRSGMEVAKRIIRVRGGGGGVEEDMACGWWW